MNADLYNHTILVRFINMVYEAHVNTQQEDTLTLSYVVYIRIYSFHVFILYLPIVPEHDSLRKNELNLYFYLIVKNECETCLQPV